MVIIFSAIFIGLVFMYLGDRKMKPIWAEEARLKALREKEIAEKAAKIKEICGYSKFSTTSHTLRYVNDEIDRRGDKFGMLQGYTPTGVISNTECIETISEELLEKLKGHPELFEVIEQGEENFQLANDIVGVYKERETLVNEQGWVDGNGPYKETYFVEKGRENFVPYKVKRVLIKCLPL